MLLTHPASFPRLKCAPRVPVCLAEPASLHSNTLLRHTETSLNRVEVSGKAIVRRLQEGD